MADNKTKLAKAANLTKDAVSKLQQVMAKPSTSALIYGYLKEKDVNLMQMTVDEWKEIEKDLVEIILADVYPGEEVSEDQLNFTTLTRSIAFMSNFIETLNKNLDESMSASDSKVKSDNDDNGEQSKQSASGPKFEF